MSDRTVLYYRPTEVGFSNETRKFVEDYTDQLYPRRLKTFSRVLRDWYHLGCKNVVNGRLEYFLSHSINTETNRFTLKEKFWDNSRKDALSIDIEPIEQEVKDTLMAFMSGDDVTSSVSTVIANLEDELSHAKLEGIESAWKNIEDYESRMLLNLLKSCDRTTRVVQSLRTIVDNKIALKVVLVIPGVIGYQISISWST